VETHLDDPATSHRFTYVGSELELFARARKWKAYLEAQVRPFLGPTVLEVGAGIGATTEALGRRACEQWVCLEPDAQLASEIVARRRTGGLPDWVHVEVGTLETLELDTFDSVIYIDVLEHIEDDRAELQRAARHLARGAHLVVLSPAHAWLYSPFDRAIGHYRRYSASSLQAIAPAGLRLVRLRYLDVIGTLTSAANRLFLTQQMPTPAQIALWDRLMVPVSRVVDPLIGYGIGRSVLAVWQKP
jgi:ubiquinone/menaquinone biosynthesis C-methylase UbiE